MMSNRVGHKRRFDATVDHCLADIRLTILVLDCQKWFVFLEIEGWWGSHGVKRIK